MKTIKYFILTVIAFALNLHGSHSLINAQESQETIKFLTDDPDPELSGWFTTREVAQNVWCIDDHGAAKIYLVAGEDSALIIDTGIGAANLRDYIKSLTNLPLIIVNTHGHSDHAGANYQFTEPIYAHSLDFESIRAYDKAGQSSNIGATMTGGAEVPEDEIFTDTLDLKPIELRSVTEGYKFDLGGRYLEVMEVPGHTPGQIILLDVENKILFTGDNNNVLVWLHLRGCAPLEVYLESLIKQNQRTDEFNTLMPGHGSPLESSFIEDQVNCVRQILDGTCEAKTYETFAGNGMICTFGRASVVYDPENLFNKD